MLQELCGDGTGPPLAKALYEFMLEERAESRVSK